MRVLRTVAENLPQPVHGGTDAVLELDDGIVGPKALAKLFAGHDLARMLKQGFQNAKRLVRQPGGLAAFVLQFPCAEIRRKPAKWAATGGRGETCMPGL